MPEPTEFHRLIQNIPAGKRLSQIQDLWILTDEIDHPSIDQVFPMYPEQPFFLDHWDMDKLNQAHVLEIGLGSGVLSIGALKAGAKQVTALEINPRAKLFAGFNALLNDVSTRLHIVDGNPTDLWAPVRGSRFDYIISNPPFMPSPPDGQHYFHSGGGGLLGMDFLANIFRELDDHLTPNGHAQIVTAAPGDDQLPTALLHLIERHLSGSAKVIIDPYSIPLDSVTHHLPQGVPSSAIDSINKELYAGGTTHEYMCVIQYDQGPKTISTVMSEPQPAWDLPLPSIQL
ncbi:MAG: 50S ribosomal protein L11 methyltransferase [Cyanobium sp.]|jgi:release factor glutamine methyltransferase